MRPGSTYCSRASIVRRAGGSVASAPTATIRSPSMATPPPITPAGVTTRPLPDHEIHRHRPGAYSAGRIRTERPRCPVTPMPCVRPSGAERQLQSFFFPSWRMTAPWLKARSILLPDISGYTEFMTKTELSHSSHIINELLDAILAANTGDFVLSEVEGDALLLYQKGKPIEADALVRQCLSMFESFHTQLKIIERDSICPCGACKTASNLTLKFVAHHGMVQEIKVRQFTQALGDRHGRRPPPMKNGSRHTSTSWPRRAVSIARASRKPRALSPGSERTMSIRESARSSINTPRSPDQKHPRRSTPARSARWSSSATMPWRWRSTRRCWRSISW